MPTISGGIQIKKGKLVKGDLLFEKLGIKPKVEDVKPKSLKSKKPKKASPKRGKK